MLLQIFFLLILLSVCFSPNGPSYFFLFQFFQKLCNYYFFIYLISNLFTFFVIISTELVFPIVYFVFCRLHFLSFLLMPPSPPQYFRTQCFFWVWIRKENSPEEHRVFFPFKGSFKHFLCMHYFEPVWRVPYRYSLI